MKKIKSTKYITVLTDYGRIPLFFHAKPFLDDKKNRFYFTNSLKKVLYKDTNKYLILIRNPKVDTAESIKNIFYILKKKYEKIFYFDDDASPRVSRVDILKHVDKYFKSKLYKDKNLYQSHYQSIPTYVQYYARMLSANLEPDSTKDHVDEGVLHKLELSWNLGIGYYPMYTRLFRLASLMAHLLSPKVANFFLKKSYIFLRYKKKEKDSDLITAQFSTYKDNELYSYQRDKILSEKFENHVLTKKQKNKDYNNTLSKSTIVISPFGYGEICFRDFEAILSHNLLIKPNMDHIETYPNIYSKDQTYVSLDWNLNDIKQTINKYSQDNRLKSYIIQNSYMQYEIAKSKITSKLENIIMQIQS